MSDVQHPFRGEPDENIFALIDPAGVPNLYARLEALGQEYTPLANGRAAVTYARVSPYVTRIDNSHRSRRLIDDAITARSLIWIMSNTSLEKLRSRLFMFYYARRGRHHVYMRISDPAYFITLMEVLTPRQARLLALVRYFVVPRIDAGQDRRYRYDPDPGSFKIIPQADVES